MTQGLKYATLPDIDSAPDIYQTAEVLKERRQSASSQGSLSHGSSDHENATGVVRRRVEPGKARTKFRPARVSARNVDFSDRISDRRQSYRVSRATKRSQKNGEVIESHPSEDGEDEEISDLEETFDEKVSRLRREIEEVKAESERLNSEQSGQSNGHSADGSALLDLGELLRSIEVSTAARAHQHSQNNRATTSQAQGDQAEPPDERGNEYHASANDSEGMERAISRVGQFETRLALLESALGIHNDQSVLDMSRPQRGKNVLSTLSGIEKDLTILSDVTVPSLEALDKKIRQASEDAKQLEETKRTTEVTQEHQRPSTSRPGSNPTNTQPQSQPDNEQKIAALYDTLPNIEAMTPLLPSVLDRLRALRLMHENAAAADDNLSALERRQSEINSEIVKWQQGLEKVIEAIESGAKTAAGNKDEINQWIRDLEGRMKTLG